MIFSSNGPHMTTELEVIQSILVSHYFKLKIFPFQCITSYSLLFLFFRCLLLLSDIFYLEHFYYIKTGFHTCVKLLCFAPCLKYQHHIPLSTEITERDKTVFPRT